MKSGKKKTGGVGTWLKGVLAFGHQESPTSQAMEKLTIADFFRLAEQPNFVHEFSVNPDLARRVILALEEVEGGARKAALKIKSAMIEKGRTDLEI